MKRARAFEERVHLGCREGAKANTGMLRDPGHVSVVAIIDSSSHTHQENDPRSLSLLYIHD